MSRKRSDTRSAIRALIRAVHGLTVAQQAQTKALESIARQIQPMSVVERLERRQKAALESIDQRYWAEMYTRTISQPDSAGTDEFNANLERFVAEQNHV